MPEHSVPGFLSVLEAIERCEKTFEVQFTAFLDPETRIHGAKCFSQTECHCLYFGGSADSEYQVLGVFPSHAKAETSEFPIIAFEINYQAQFGAIAHKDVLGALMSLGLERKVFGDILVGEGKAYFFVLSHLTDYLVANMEKVARQGIRLEPIALNFVPVVPDERQEVCFSVSSLRLDAVVAQAFHLSRNQAADFIRQGWVKLDYVIVDKIDVQVTSQQLVSVRRQGRFWVGEVMGLSKKGKLRLSGWMTRV